MNQQETALYLNISVRSLQRLVQAGRLPVRYERGKTRSVPTFDSADVEVLRAGLQSRPIYPQQKAAEQRMQPFGVRLTLQQRQQLCEEAERHGMHPSPYARLLMQMALESELQGQVRTLQAEVRDLREEASQLREALGRLRLDFVSSTQVVLEFSGLDPTSAKKWVAQNLRGRT